MKKKRTQKSWDVMAEVEAVPWDYGIVSRYLSEINDEFRGKRKFITKTQNFHYLNDAIVEFQLHHNIKFTRENLVIRNMIKRFFDFLNFETHPDGHVFRLYTSFNHKTGGVICRPVDLMRTYKKFIEIMHKHGFIKSNPLIDWDPNPDMEHYCTFESGNDYFLPKDS